jgi:hypothetical protein
MGADPFSDWYQAAGVRGGTRRMLREETDQGKAYFPARLMPYLDHEMVRALGPVERHALIVRHLYQFLLATTHLETRVVNRGAERIANNRIGMAVSTATRLDAFKVYCDEGYHSLYSLDLAAQVATTTGIPIPDWDFGGFAARLDAVAEQLIPDEPGLAELLQVVVFETLITAVLNELPNDPTIVTTVQELSRDHARDEGRHHRFFSAFFHELWTNLDTPLRIATAHAMPSLIQECLRWDVDPVHRSLELSGLPPADAAAVVGDAYGGAQDLVQTVSATVRMCSSAGVFDVPGAWESFVAKGLIADG